MSFMTRWKLFAWSFISAPIWLWIPLILLFELSSQVAFPLIALSYLLGSYFWMRRIIKCQHCQSSLYDWWFSKAQREYRKSESGAKLQLHLVVALVSKANAEKYFGEAHCPHCGQSLESHP